MINGRPDFIHHAPWEPACLVDPHQFASPSMQSLEVAWFILNRWPFPVPWRYTRFLLDYLLIFLISLTLFSRTASYRCRWPSIFPNLRIFWSIPFKSGIFMRTIASASCFASDSKTHYIFTQMTQSLISLEYSLPVFVSGWNPWYVYLHLIVLRFARSMTWLDVAVFLRNLQK